VDQADPAVAFLIHHEPDSLHCLDLSTGITSHIVQGNPPSKPVLITLLTPPTLPLSGYHLRS
jgi:hypothetical protein